jgi:hypothetical protein
MVALEQNAFCGRRSESKHRGWIRTGGGENRSITGVVFEHMVLAKTRSASKHCGSRCVTKGEWRVAGGGRGGVPKHRNARISDTIATAMVTSLVENMMK